MTLRDEIAAIVGERMFAAELRAKEHVAMADRILAIPQIKEALEINRVILNGMKTMITATGKSR